MIRQLLCGLVLLNLGFAMFPAIAKECGPLKRVASVNLLPQPSTNSELVPVAVNGSPKLFLLDTGGGATQISLAVARALKLSLQTGASPIVDLSGNVSTAFVKADTFAFGGAIGNNVYLRVAPNDMVDGILAPDLMKRFDVEMDFASQKLNYFQSDHCPGKVVYWPHAGDVAQIPINLADGKSIKAPVKLDGQSLLATIDTGASFTTITSNTALASFGRTPASPDVKPVGNANNDPALAGYVHTFSSLTLDGVTIKNPRVRIIPDKVTGADMTGGAPYILTGAVYPFVPKHPKVPELLLGMDVLKHLHLYFAFDEHHLYVTAAEPPSASVAGIAAGGPCDSGQGPQLRPVMATHLRPPQPANVMGKDIRGPTVLQVLVNADGVPTSAITATSSGVPALDQATADFVKAHWRWQATAPACRPVPVSTEIHITWMTPGAMPGPGTLASLKRYIDSLEQGLPDYDDMTPVLADAVRRALPNIEASIKRWGALRSITFKATGAHGEDRYDVLFAHGHAEWLVSPLTADGKV